MAQKMLNKNKRRLSMPKISHRHTLKIASDYPLTPHKKTVIMRTQRLPLWACFLALAASSAHGFELKDSQIGTGQYSTGYYSQSPAVFGNGLADGVSAPAVRTITNGTLTTGRNLFLTQVPIKASGPIVSTR